MTAWGCEKVCLSMQNSSGMLRIRFPWTGRWTFRQMHSDWGCDVVVGTYPAKMADEK